MFKVMVFIDGSWLYQVRKILERKLPPGEGLEIDYGKLPRVLAEKFREQLRIPEVDLVRTYFFASIPKNYDPRDKREVEAQQDFYDLLKEEFHYETEIFEIDFKGRRLHVKDREPGDTFVPKEKCVDIALSSAMLYYAALPYAYDGAIAVIGDRDFVPVLQHVRRLGKRVMIASVHGSCSPVYDPRKEPTDPERVRDVDTVFLDEIIPEIIVEIPLQEVECQSPLHEGDRKVLVRARLRKNRPFYCPKCREKYRRMKEEIEIDLTKEYPKEVLEMVPEGYQVGTIQKLLSKEGKQYGFILSMEGKQYYFNPSHLRGAIDPQGNWREEIKFEDLKEDQYTVFLVEREPGERAGSASEVILLLIDT